MSSHQQARPAEEGREGREVDRVADGLPLDLGDQRLGGTQLEQRPLEPIGVADHLIGEPLVGRQLPDHRQQLGAVTALRPPDRVALACDAWDTSRDAAAVRRSDAGGAGSPRDRRPLLFGAVAGVFLGISATVYSDPRRAGGDRRHPRRPRAPRSGGGARRVLVGGALFGLGILLAHAIAGTDAKVSIGGLPALPDPDRRHHRRDPRRDRRRDLPLPAVSSGLTDGLQPVEGAGPHKKYWV